MAKCQIGLHWKVKDTSRMKGHPRPKNAYSFPKGHKINVGNKFWRCNKALGFAKEDPKRLIAVAEYIIKHKKLCQNNTLGKVV